MGKQYVSVRSLETFLKLPNKFSFNLVFLAYTNIRMSITQHFFLVSVKFLLYTTSKKFHNNILTGCYSDRN